MACDLYVMHTRPALIQLISMYLCGLSYPDFDVFPSPFCSNALYYMLVATSLSFLFLRAVFETLSEKPRLH